MTEKPEGGRSRGCRAARASRIFGVLALLGMAACRQIFGLDEAVSYTPDTAEADGAAGSSSMDSVTQLAAEPPAAEPPAAEPPAAEPPAAEPPAAVQAAAEQSATEQSTGEQSDRSLDVADAAADAATAPAVVCRDVCPADAGD